MNMLLNKLSDEMLMLKYQEGNIRAFEVLFSRHRKGLYSFLFRLLKNRENADEAFQEVFLRIIKVSKLGSYKVSAKFVTYLYTIARNICIDLKRKQRLVHEESFDEEYENTSYKLIDKFPTAANQESDLLSDERNLKVLDAIEKLPLEQKEVLMLRQEKNLKMKEIAKIVRCSENTVKSRLRYALQNISKAINMEANCEV